VFERSGRPVAILVSHDEYLALRETIDIGKDERLRERIAAADAQAQRGAVMLPEDLFGE
jgi:PHD/YefM family antitoxin component YafN of YafNO toxin-antitoxin module